MAKNFPNLARDINLQIQKDQQIPNRKNPKKSKPRHIITKFLKTKDRKNLESSQRKMTSFL